MDVTDIIWARIFWWMREGRRVSGWMYIRESKIDSVHDSTFRLTNEEAIEMGWIREVPFWTAITLGAFKIKLIFRPDRQTLHSYKLRYIQTRCSPTGQVKRKIQIILPDLNWKSDSTSDLNSLCRRASNVGSDTPESCLFKKLNNRVRTRKHEVKIEPNISWSAHERENVNFHSSMRLCWQSLRHSR